MRALVLPAENELPRLEELPQPRPAEQQILIKVSAAGLNYADTMMRRGFYLQKPSFPYIPGFEFSGVVTEAGSRALHWKPGDRVMGTAQNTFAEFITAP